MSCDYLIVEGLTFEMFGSVTRTTGSLHATTASANNGSGFVRFTVDSTHTLKVGDVVSISGHTPYNTTGTITAINTGVVPNTFDTDIAWGGSERRREESGPRDLSMAYVAASKGGLRLSTCTNIVIRDCGFNQASYADNNANNSAITIEDSAFTGHGWWTQFYADPLIDDNWDAIKDTPNEDYALMAQQGSSRA